MPSAPPPAAILSFGPFVLDTRSLVLTRSGVPLPLTGLPLRILEILLASPGRVVTRSELKQALWPHAMRIDTERRLNTAMRALRETLGDAAGTPLFVETIRGRGYRWIGHERSPPRSTARASRFAAVAMCLALLLPASSVRLAPHAAPGDLVAQIHRAQFAMDDWREHPTEPGLANARAVLGAARQTVGEHPDIDVLAAELRLGADWDWPGAERLDRRAIAADPNNKEARRGLAWLYVNGGREPEAWAEIVSLLAVAPLTADLRADLGWLMLRMDRAELALAMCAPVNDDHINLLSCRHTALARMGSLAEARDAALVLLDALAVDPSIVAAVRGADPRKGYEAFLDWRVEGFLPRQGHWFQHAQIEAEAGRLEEALASLERAAAAHDPMMVKIGSTLEFDLLTGSPRYRALLDKVFARTGLTSRQF